MLLTSPLSSPLKNPVRDLFSPAGSSQSLTAQVQALFAAGRVGGMWDCGDIATLFQDTAGATPITAVTQGIARVNDKSGLSNHATQPTAGSRSLFSARKNLLTKTEVFTDAAWAKLGVTVTANNATAPDGTLTASTITFPSGGGANQIYQTLTATTMPVTQGAWLRSASTVSADFGFYDSTVDTQTISITSAWTYFTKTRASGLTGGDRRGIWIYPNVPATIEIWHPQIEVGSVATSYQRINTASDYDTVGFPAFAQFDATDDALLFPAITFGGAFNTFVAGKVTGGTQGVHLWRTADVNGTWAKYKSGDATTPTGTGSGSPTYAVNGTALSPSQQGQLFTQINGVDCVVESIGVVLTAETALQFSGFAGSLFTGNSHRVLMISGTLTAGEKLLCRQWAAEGNGVTVV